MAVLDKEIKVIMLKGERGLKGQNGKDGKSSYELAKENLLFSGTLEEWIKTFATPENYFTRAEIQRVTQAEYDKLVETGQVAPNCYYLITDDNTLETLESSITLLKKLISALQINKIEKAITSNNGYISTITNSGTGIELKTAKVNGKQNFSVEVCSDDIYFYGEDQNGFTTVDFTLLDINGRINDLEGQVSTLKDVVNNDIIDFTLPATGIIAKRTYVKYASYATKAGIIQRPIDIDITNTMQGNPVHIKIETAGLYLCNISLPSGTTQTSGYENTTFLIDVTDLTESAISLEVGGIGIQYTPYGNYGYLGCGNGTWVACKLLVEY